MKTKFACSLVSDIEINRQFTPYLLGGLGFCVLWTVGSVIWPGVVVSSGLLAALATISAAAIVLALTAGLIGLQLMSRYGSRASRMMLDSQVGAWIIAAAVLGVGLPLWAAAEPSPWLEVAGFACFSWSIFTLSFAGFLTLSRLNPRELALRSVRQVFPLPADPSERVLK
jgi:hypothetical protein